MLLLPLWTVQLYCFSWRQIVLKPANPDERKERLGAHSTDFNFEPFYGLQAGRQWIYLRSGFGWRNSYWAFSCHSVLWNIPGFRTVFLPLSSSLFYPSFQLLDVYNESFFPFLSWPWCKCQVSLCITAASAEEQWNFRLCWILFIHFYFKWLVSIKIQRFF